MATILTATLMIVTLSVTLTLSGTGESKRTGVRAKPEENRSVERVVQLCTNAEATKTALSTKAKVLLPMLRRTVSPHMQFLCFQSLTERSCCLLSIVMSRQTCNS